MPRTKSKPRASAAKPAPLVTLAMKILDDGKAEAPVVIDLKGKSDIADHMIIASGRSQRQVVAMAEHLVDGLKAAGYRRIRIEGLPLGDWVLIDAGDLLVHLFRPDVRAHYNLEKMWGDELGEAAGAAI